MWDFVWDLGRTIAALGGTTVGIWGAWAAHRARQSEARWKGPEVTLAPSRQDEEGWVQMLVLVKNRLDVEMRIENVEVIKPRGASILGMAAWERRSAMATGATSKVRLGTAVLPGPSDKNWSAKVPVFIKAEGWDPFAENVQARVVLRETSMGRRERRLEVVSMDMKRPQPEGQKPPVMPRSRDPWMVNDR